MTTIKVTQLSTLKQKTKGLLGEKKSKPIYFKTHFGIHTFFMKFPIDVVILDGQNRVVRLKNMKPNRIFVWDMRFNRVLELPEGSIKKLKIKKAEKILLSIS